MVNLAKGFGVAMGAITCGVSSSDEHAKNPHKKTKQRITFFILILIKMFYLQQFLYKKQ
jgi:hypothetical protein